ncbi:hypothetical protein [Pseudomonas sp. NPDC089569]|uniref:hypothetical protein n=1 Tax=Pseudomonas sp. NPDC089569 TaxID=3390722 RepID=UPI003D0160C2
MGMRIVGGDPRNNSDPSGRSYIHLILNKLKFWKPPSTHSTNRKFATNDFLLGKYKKAEQTKNVQPVTTTSPLHHNTNILQTSSPEQILTVDHQEAVLKNIIDSENKQALRLINSLAITKNQSETELTKLAFNSINGKITKNTITLTNLNPAHSANTIRTDSLDSSKKAIKKGDTQSPFLIS